MTDDLPRDAVARIDADNPTGRLDTGTVGALIDGDDDPSGRVDVGHRGWNNAVGLTLAVEAADGACIATTAELSPAAARELAAALNRRAAEVEIPPGEDECLE